MPLPQLNGLIDMTNDERSAAIHAKIEAYNEFFSKSGIKIYGCGFCSQPMITFEVDGFSVFIELANNHIVIDEKLDFNRQYALGEKSIILLNHNTNHDL
jgi:hypothetical protein